MSAAKGEKRFVRKNISLTDVHIFRLDCLAQRDSVSASDEIRRLIDAEWDRLDMVNWLRDRQERERQERGG